MGYALLWIENLATTLLIVALLVTGIARTRRFGRLLLGAVLVILFLAVYGSTMYVTGYLQYGLGVRSPFAFFGGLGVLVALGALALVIVGMRRAGPDEERAARAWRPDKLALAALVALALQMMTFWNLDNEVKTRLSALRAEAGTLALSVAPARVPDRDNAALLYRQAGELIPKEWPKAYEEARGKPSAQEMWAPALLNDPEIAAFLDRQAPTLALLRRAAAMPGCYFDHEYGRPSIDMLLPELGELRHAARLLQLDARCQAARGQTAAALRDVAAMFALSRDANSEPILIACLVSIAIHEMAIDTLEATLATGKYTAEDLAALPLDSAMSFAREMQRSLATEEAFGLSIFCQVTSDHGLEVLEAIQNSPGGGPARGPLWHVLAGAGTSLYRVFLVSDDIEGYRSLLHQYRQAATQPYAQMKQMMPSADAAAHSGVLTRLVAPALERAIARGIQADAHLRAAQAGLALARYRAAQQRYPNKLADLVPQYLPAVPVDPYDGQPLRYRADDRGVVVYSVGPDLKDDQGAAFDRAKQTGDIGFKLPR